MKQHRPRVSEENYQHVMSNLTGRFGENETFDNALWVLIAEYENLEDGRLISNDNIKMLKKELSNTTGLLITETKRANKSLWVALVSAFVAASALIYIGICL